VSLGVSFAGGAEAQQLKTAAPIPAACKSVQEKAGAGHTASVESSQADLGQGRYKPEAGHEKLGREQVASVTVKGYDSHQVKQIIGRPHCGSGK
jgi:hypothetical protein